MPHFAASLTARLPRICIALCAFLTLPGILCAQAPTIPNVPTTPGNIAVVAGTQTTGHAGDGSQATATGVKMTNPDGLVLDSNGNLYISEYNTTSVNGYVRMVDPKSGLISTYAGGGSAGSNTSPSGGAATSYALTGIQALAIDSANNIYLTDSSHYVIDKISATDQTMTAIAGTYLTQGSTDGVATSASFRTLVGLAVDPSGNVYISDQGNDTIRMIYEGGTIPTALSAVTSSPQVGNVYTIAGLAQTPCTPTTHPCGDGGPANLSRFSGTSLSALTLDSAGNLYIADKGTDAALRVIYQSGAALACLIQVENPTLFNLPPGATSCAGASPATPTPGYIYTIAGTQGTACTTTACGDGGLATSGRLSNTVVGVVVDPAGNVLISDSSDEVVRIVYAGGGVPPALLAVTASPTPGYIYTIAGTFRSSGFTGIPGPATGAKLKSAYGLALDPQGNLFIADAVNFDVYALAGGGAVPLASQTITFPTPPAVTYGVASFTLTGATASSTLPVTYSVVSGPASLSGGMLTITGAGPVVIEADQAGNSTYAAAAPVQQTLTVNKATITVTGITTTLPEGTAAPSPLYTISGLVSPETTTGAPGIQTNYTTSSSIGTYPIVVTAGNLAVSDPGNYNAFVFTNGNITVGGGSTQTITPPTLPATITYGVAPIPLNATSSAGLPITYSGTGSAVVTGTQATGYSLTIVSAGTGTITENQSGNSTYAAAAPVTQVISVAPATLTVTAPTFSQPYGTALPSLSAMVAGLVGHDATIGSPTLNTAYTVTDPPGTKDQVAISQGSLAIAAPALPGNYTFDLVPGLITVTQGSNTITFPSIPTSSQSYGAVINLNATASSKLPITYTVTGNATINGSTVNITGLGTITITASQTGNGNYAAAMPVTQTFTARQAVLTVTAQPVTKSQGAVNPTLAAVITGFVNGDANTPLVLTGAPQVTTTATQSSPAGSYPITPSIGTLASINYTFAFVPDVMVINGTPGYIVTATPNALTVPMGQARQTSLIIQAVNSYQGSVTFSCGQVPVGLTCTFSPATVNVVTPSGSSGATDQSTLTVSATGPTAQLLMPSQSGHGTTMAGILLIPGGLAGLLLLVQRKRGVGKVHIKQLLALMVLLSGVLGLGACGTSSNIGQAPLGNTTLLITATGAGTPGTGSQNATNILYLTVNVTNLQ